MERPIGTVTFLFTDVEGSTRLLQDLGTGPYGEALALHRGLVRDAVLRHGGFEVDTQGDAFMLAFARAGQAVLAAADAQRALSAQSWPGDRALQVRMGVHSCEAQPSQEGYVGIGVHRAARLCAAGHGGQVLVSHTARALLEEEGLPVQLRDLGEHRLKDLMEPKRIYQLEAAGLEPEFPPLRSVATSTGLPIQPTPLLGREAELTEIRALVTTGGVRMLTLTGAGGSGKTRLALQAGAELDEPFGDGVYFVELATITDPALVSPAIAQVIGLNESAGQSLPAYLGSKAILIIVDNFEQVVDGASELAWLLLQAPNLTILATSREPLRLRGERVLLIPPLDAADAEALFVERASAADPQFTVTAATTTAIERICARLDGLPLAIELAAARTRVLAPEALLERLSERLNVLTSGARDLPQRQQTLRNTLAWSYDLLDEREQALFARLGVFAGGFALDAAERVAGATLDGLGALVDKSLVRRDTNRFVMLETIREFALERLVSLDERETRERHTEFFIELAEAAYRDRFTAEVEWSERLEHEHDNLRAALAWIGENESGRGRQRQLAGALGWFWHAHSHLEEGQRRLEQALQEPGPDDAVSARALAALTEVAAWRGVIAVADPTAQAAVQLWRDLGRPREAALTLLDLGWGLFWTGNDTRARVCMEESLKLMRTVADELLILRAEAGLLQVLVSIGEVDTVEAMATQALPRSQRLGDLRSEHLLHHYLADSALIRGNPEPAKDLYILALRAAIQLGDRVEIALEVMGIAMAVAGRGDSRLGAVLADAARSEIADRGADVSGVRFWAELESRYLGTATSTVDPTPTFSDAITLALDA